MRPSLALSSLAVLCVAAPAMACLHPPSGFTGKVEESSQQIIVLHHDGEEELILQVDYKLAKGDKAPEHIAWVVPTPSLPHGYKVEDPKLFRELSGLVKQQDEKPKPKSIGGLRRGRGVPNGLVVHAKVSVGEYEITPLEARGADAGKALNGWLTKGGYGAVPEANMAWYLKRNWTFLAIKINPQKATGDLGKAGAFRPLRIAFASDELVVPLKFSSHQGSFDVTITVITESLQLDAMRSAAAPFGFSAVAWVRELKIPDSAKAVKALQARLAKDSKVQLKRWAVLKLFGKQINRPRRSVADWEDDFSLPAGKRPKAD